ncbi:MAG: M28 family peptidase [Bacteroidia bacterium]
MMKRIFALSLFIVAFSNLLFAQPAINENNVTPLLKQHIQTLASDLYEGRETGTHGEQLSFGYIIQQFEDIGLEPRGDVGFLQPFPFSKGYELGDKNALKVEGKNFELKKDFIPMPYYFSATVTAEVVNVGYGIVAPKLDYDDYAKVKVELKGKIFLIEFSSPEGDNPHSKYGDYADLQTKIDTAKQRGAAAIIFINTMKDVKDPEPDYTRRIGKESLPVIFVKGDAAKKLLKSKNQKSTLTVDLKKIEGTGHNVIGYINNNSKNTVVITAHYDHLGFGGEGSLYRGAPAVHNGADDNASGTAAIIEIARYIKLSNLKNNNYMFIAFSGEEKGLLGSNYYVKHPKMPLAQVNYNINLDMVGRLKSDTAVLIINGVGTSPMWKDALAKITLLKTKTTESGVGPSDQTSFYLENIPAIHFFSGTHEDYHKPTDDEDKINYHGEVQIIDFILELISGLDDKGKLPFTKTKDSENEDRPRFKVTLGVIPDYAYEGEGMRIDGVTDGRPASVAGLLKGDVVLQIGEEKVGDMTTYMKALGKFNKGDKVKVKVKRGEEMVEKDVIF